MSSVEVDLEKDEHLKDVALNSSDGMAADVVESDGSDEYDDALKKEKREDEEIPSFPMRDTAIRLPGNLGEMHFNHVSTVFGFAFLWGLSIWCMAQPTDAKERLTEWKADVTEKFTWFYIVANPCFTFFVLWLAYRYGDIKLGKKDEKPEFDDASYFMMLFSAGVGVGLFFYGVGEPLWHRDSHWYVMSGYHSQDEVDQFAMVLTMYHWGLAGWSPYIVVAVAAGIASYRFDLPMTVRSTLYHVFGTLTWGWIGDVVDGFSIVMTVAGVCTSLGLGSMQIITGATRMGWIDSFEESGMTQDEYDDDLTDKQVSVIWIITAMATASVVSGLSVGIKLLSQIGFGLGMLLLVIVLALEKTNFLFNFTVQTVGMYFQTCIFQVPFWTDAFGQLEEGEGRAIDGDSAETWWMNSWTVFYMAWWTAWGAFVGLFLARISRGRTIRQVVVYSFIAPLAYAFMWFCTFGGVGLRQARQAEELEKLGNETFNDAAYFRSPDSKFCYDVPQEDVVVNGSVVFTNTLPGVTPVCQFDSSDATQSWFNVMYSFSFPESTSGDDDFAGFGGFMAGLSLVALTVYFVTSSDSGSLIVDHLASNGSHDHHWVQRVFWAFTEGAVATALLVAGGGDALDALQAASIVFGLPFNLFLFCMMYSIVKMCDVAEKQESEGITQGKLPKPEDTSFKMHLFGGIANIFEFVLSFGFVHEELSEQGLDMPTSFQVVEFFIGLFLPFFSLYRILVHLQYSPIATYATTLTYAALYVLWVTLFGLTAKNYGYVGFGFTVFLMNACILTTVRTDVRTRRSLDGNLVADFAAASFFYPQALCQMLYEFHVTGGEDGPQVAEVVEA